MDTDNDANRALDGKEVSAGEIVMGSEPVLTSARPPVNLLDKTSPARK